MTDEETPRRLPLPSEDEGDLVNEPPEGMTDDYLVAQEEGVPWTPPLERVISEPRTEHGGPDVAGTSGDPGEELSRQSSIDQPDGDILVRALEALRRSDLPAGDHLVVGAVGSTVHLAGEVESMEVLDEVIALLESLPGVERVVDTVTVAGT
jgi:hypothetical protein